MIPKIIWRYWATGWETAPFVVKKCTESIHRYASDYEIIDIDDKNVENYIQLPEKLLNTKNFPVQTKSDLIRIMLLAKYGGVWIDATIFLNKPLSIFMDQIGDVDFFFLGVGHIKLPCLVGSCFPKKWVYCDCG